MTGRNRLELQTCVSKDYACDHIGSKGGWQEKRSSLVGAFHHEQRGQHHSWVLRRTGVGADLLASTPIGSQGDPKEAAKLAARPPSDRGSAWRGTGPGWGRDPRQPAAVSALDLDRQGSAAEGDDAGHERAAQYLRRHRAGHRALGLPDRGAGQQHHLHRVPGQILLAYPLAPAIANVLDNGSTHSSRAIERWLLTAGSSRSMALATAPTTTRWSESGRPRRHIWPTRPR